MKNNKKQFPWAETELTDLRKKDQEKEKAIKDLEKRVKKLEEQVDTIKIK